MHLTLTSDDETALRERLESSIMFASVKAAWLSFLDEIAKARREGGRRITGHFVCADGSPERYAVTVDLV